MLKNGLKFKSPSYTCTFISTYLICVAKEQLRLDGADLWLAIRFKMMTSCTWAFLPRIIVYNRYVWGFIPYTTIYIAYIRVFNTRICAKSNALLYALLKPVYMRTCQSPRICVQRCAYTRGSEIRLGISCHEKCL